MKNIKLIIEYDGLNYSGWQNQDNVITIQEKIEEAIKLVTGDVVKLTASGRTDGKVHALGQVANFYTNCTIPADRLKFALNDVLPDDIAIVDSEEVELDFHARFSATKKRYRYLIYNGKVPSPIYRNFSYHVKYDLDLEKMKEGAKKFIGTHDFASFKGRKSIVNNTVRTIYKLDIEKKDNFIEITIEGNSFLRYMVRIIVGTLVGVGSGRFDTDDISMMLTDKNRGSAGITAPPQGLYLEEVYYN